MSEWTYNSIGDGLAEIFAGGTPTTGESKYWNGNIVWITPADLSESRGIYINDSERKITMAGVKKATGKIMPANAVVISCRAPVGYCAIPTVPFSTNQGCKTLITSNKIHSMYLYYYLLLSKDKLNNVSSGTTFLELPKKELARFVIKHPKDVTEQAKIAEVLSTIDEAIDVSRNIIKKYKSVQTGMLEDFTSYGRYANCDRTNASVSPERFVGLIPDNWIIAPLSVVTEKIADRDHTTPVYVNQGVLIVSPKDFDEDQYIDFEGCAHISLEAHLINKKKTDIAPGDLIFTRIGAALGKVCHVDESMPEFSILHSAAMIRTNEKLLPRFLMYSIRANYFQRQIDDGKQSIGVPDLGMDKINSLLVKYPASKDEQQFIVDALDTIEGKIVNERTYFKKLLKIKQGLMQDLLTQNVSVEPIM